MNQLSDLPDVGIAITFSSYLLDLITRRSDLVDAIEIEPQSLWSEHPDSPVRYRSNADVDQILDALQFRKLVHSIGLPVGGSFAHDPQQTTLLAETVERLDSPWFSEHLSFNKGPDGFTGFFLPPRQTLAGIEQCAASARDLQQRIGRPMAIETGVNYLRPRSDEIDDGVFTAMVAAEADCGILLDLHNIYTNERNGRQTMHEFVSQLDLSRVVEVHVAGGMELDGYWLDAHSGAMPHDMIDRSREIIASLPNLRAITFEVYPAFLEDVGENVVVEQLELVRSLWEERGRRQAVATARPTVCIAQPDPGPAPDEWERDLAALVTVRHDGATNDHGHNDDDGLALLRRLSLEFRASMISTNLTRTTRLMLLVLGEDVFRMFLDEFRRTHPPQIFAASEALSFAAFLTELKVNVPQLDAVLRFEVAALKTRLDGETRVVAFEFDPMPMLQALSERRLPDQSSAAGDYEIEITGDEPVAISG